MDEPSASDVVRESPEPDRLLLRGSVRDGHEADAEGSFLLPTGTVTFLLTDVEGSSAGWDRHPEAMAKAIARHYDILAECIGRHRGVRPIEQGEGDSVVGAFSRASDAVAAALDAQQAFATEPWPGDAALRVRMALHAGDSQLRDAFNYFGPVVIRCARLRSLAHGGQILASGAVHDLASERLSESASWRDLGVHRLRDLTRPEHVYQLCHPDLPDDFPELRSLDAVPNNLPAQVSTFIGRENELRAAGSFLDGHRLVTLTGSGGCGKTRLALQLGAERVDQHPNGVWYVELAALGTGSVDRQIADVLGVGDEPDRSLVESLVARVGADRVLLILDNCEHVLDAVAPIVDHLVRQCPALTVLATSRQPLAVIGEVSWRVPSMAVPRSLPSPGDIPALGRFDAIQLFSDRAVRSRPEFALDERNAQHVVEICQRLDGIPLAIELAAARVRQMSVADIVRGLDDRFRLLTAGARTVLPRQQTLVASVDWSHDLLDAEEQQVFRMLAVFGGPFTIEAAAAVVIDGDHGDVGRTRAAVAVAELVDRSLVQIEEGGEETRYRLLETIKAYGRERLHADEDLEVLARQRHLAFHLHLAEQAEPEVQAREDERWLARLDRSHDDLRLALQWAYDNFDSAAVLRLAASLGPYWHARGHSAEGQHWYSLALENAGVAPEMAARCLWASAYLALYATDFGLAGERAEQALELATSIGQTATIARSLDTLGTLQQFGDPLGAMPALQRAADLAAEAGDLWCRTDCLQKLAYSAYYCDSWDEAISFGDQARVLLEQLDNPFFRGWADILDGTAALRRGQLDRALELHTQALAGAQILGEPLSLLVAGAMLVFRALAEGDHATAAEAVAATEAALGDQIRAGYYAAIVGSLKALVLFRQGDAHTAAGILGEVCNALLGEGVVYPTSDFLGFHAEALLAVGATVAANAAIDQLESLNATLQSRRAGPMVHYLRALAHQVDGRPDLAEPHARAALTDWLAFGLPLEATDALELLAGIIGDLGNVAESTRLWAAAAGIRNKGGWTGRRSPQLDDRVAEHLVAARDALAERFDELWAQGVELDLPAAAELASRARGTRRRPPSGWASLTPTELAVARLVAVGRTNPEIAAELVMSRATVKTHISHILTKLDLKSRSQVAAELTRREALS